MSPLNITQPLGIWSIMATIRWCPIFPKWDSYQPLFPPRRRTRTTVQAKASRKERHMTQGGVEPSTFRLRVMCSTNWARPAWCEKVCSANLIPISVSGKGSAKRKQPWQADKHRGQEPRELTVVEPLCVAKALRRTKWQHVWCQVAAPLFGGSRPLTAGKGVQR